MNDHIKATTTLIRCIPIVKLLPDEAARFWTKVDKTGDCWIWKGSRLKFGQGQVRISRISKSCLLAPRVSYCEAFGSVPTDLFVLHKCDNPPCVNPAHLFLGTHEDNTADKVSKNRQHHPPKDSHIVKLGEDNPQSKLTRESVLEIRRLISMGLSQRHIAMRFDVDQSLISYLARRKIWQHV